jgi:hypothetical protein
MRVETAVALGVIIVPSGRPGWAIDRSWWGSSINPWGHERAPDEGADPEAYQAGPHPHPPVFCAAMLVGCASGSPSFVKLDASGKKDASEIPKPSKET